MATGQNYVQSYNTSQLRFRFHIMVTIVVNLNKSIAFQELQHGSVVWNSLPKIALNSDV